MVVIDLTKDGFIANVGDFEANPKDWKYESPASDGGTQPGPCLPHGKAFFRLIGHARGRGADRDHQQDAGTLQHKDHPDIRACNPEATVRGHGQVRRGNPRFETYSLILKQLNNHYPAQYI